MSIEKSEIIKSTYQRFGQKLEDVETNRKSAMHECMGGVDILKKLYKLCDSHKKQAYSEEKIKEKGLTLTSVEFILRGVTEIQDIILELIKEREGASVLYRGQMQALGNVIQMLGKEFESEDRKIQQELEYQDALERGEVPEDIRHRGRRPLGVRPERIVGNPDIGKDKPVEPEALPHDDMPEPTSKKKSKKKKNASDKPKD